LKLFGIFTQNFGVTNNSPILPKVILADLSIIGYFLTDNPAIKAFGFTRKETEKPSFLKKPGFDNIFNSRMPENFQSKSL